MKNGYFRAEVAAMSGYVPGEQPRIAGLIKLNTNENPYPPSPAVGAALRDAALRLNRYPDPMANDARNAAADLFGLDRDWILAGNGSDDILTIVTRSFVAQGGVLACPDPSYSLYPVLAQIQGAACRTVPLTDAFELPEDLEARAAGASLFFLTRPNAPTGNAFPLPRVRAFCQRFAGIVLIDEAYADFADDDARELVRELPNVIVSRTLSKSYALAHLRFGFAVANPELIAGMMKVKDSYNVNGLTQLAAAAALRDQAHVRASVQRLRTSREQVAAALRKLGFQVCPSQANFLFARPPMPAADYVAAMRAQAVLLRYFPGPRTGDHVRITIGTEAEMVRFLEVTEAVL